ncbi:hypothetical protein FQ192_26175 [Pseudomonas sp. ANT_J12]|nr:hypothetical protein FQ192_26175 [Pseudomonas sp. ANT_J12]
MPVWVWRWSCRGSVPASESLTRDLWRGGLPPLGCEAAPKVTAFSLAHRKHRFCDCCAAERGQAPSPQLV